jgi:putative transposase
MTDERLPLADLLAKAGDGDFLRSVAEAVLQMLMEADVEGLIGAGRHERTGERLNYRNGFRDRTLDTRRSCGRAVTSHPSSSLGRPRRRPWWR